MSESTINAYNMQARGYEGKWNKYLEHTHKKFLGHIETQEEDRFLDLSGGTGLLVQEIIEQDRPFGQIVLNDPSEQMLAIAQKRLGDHPAVSFTNFLAEDLPFKKNSFDRIFCLNAFHFYPRQQKVLDHLYSILKPGGTLYLLDWNREGIFCMVNKIIEWFSSEYINTRSSDELRKMVSDSGFKISLSKKWGWRYWRFLFIEARKPADGREGG